MKTFVVGGSKGIVMACVEMLLEAGHEVIVGEVKMVDLSADLILEDGTVNTTQAQTILASGLSAYHTHQFLTKKEYAKP